jgi:16S rRNA (guanine527-N7)-methyltransferase
MRSRRTIRRARAHPGAGPASGREALRPAAGKTEEVSSYPSEKIAVSRETAGPGDGGEGAAAFGGRAAGDRDRPVAPALSPEEFAAAAGVSAETLRKLTTFDDLLLAASAIHNLVARSTLADRWRRHYLDSAQIFAALAPETRTLVDLGSGAGFPGLVLAAMGEGRFHVKLVEARAKKAAFLSTAAAAMGLSNVDVVPERIESVRLSPPDAITARALAPLAKLLAYAHEIAGEKTVCYFLKGQDVEAELTEASRYWRMTVEQRPSLTAPDARLLLVRQFSPKPGQRNAKGRVHAR